MIRYPFKYENKHRAQACALFCMDFRFKDATLKYLKKQLNLEDLDIMVIAGASLNIASPRTSADYDIALKQIKLSTKLHQVNKIIIIDHADCGAYGGRTAFSSTEEEEEVHTNNLLKSKKILQEKYPNQEIILIYANLIGSEIKFQEIK